MSSTGMTSQEGLLPRRHPTNDFFVCDIFDALPKDDLATMEHPIFSLSTRPDRRILEYAHNGTEITVRSHKNSRPRLIQRDAFATALTGYSGGLAVVKLCNLR